MKAVVNAVAADTVYISKNLKFHSVAPVRTSLEKGQSVSSLSAEKDLQTEINCYPCL